MTRDRLAAAAARVRQATGAARVRLALALTAGLFALRWWLGDTLGFADAEALYAAYAMHPQPAYLDHPGLVGAIMRVLADGAPSPRAAHRLAAILSTLLPWWGLFAARLTGARGDRLLHTYFALALVPEIAIGLFSINPDLPLAYCWIATLGLTGLALRSDPGTTRALAAALGAAGFAALATLAKVSGALLFPVLLVALATRPGRRHARTSAPWFAALLALVILSPLVLWEVREDYPMLRHRLVATQAEAGLSLRNLGALIGGQLLYVTPPFLWAAWKVWKGLEHCPIAARNLLRGATLLPGIVLGALCVWSRVAEPHWMAPAYLALTLGAAHAGDLGKRLRRACAGVGLFVIALSALWVGTALPPALLGPYYEPRYDLANDLYAWGPGRDLVKAAARRARRETGTEPIVVGPHWVICAQAHVALVDQARVGCRTPEGDDYDRWFPRVRWHDAPVILYVTDDRFGLDPRRAFPNRIPVWSDQVVVRRGGRDVRRLEVTRMDQSEAVASVGQKWMAVRATSRSTTPSRTSCLMDISKVCIP